MAVIGVLTRVEAARRNDAMQALAALSGVEVFELEDPRSLAVVISAVDEERGHEVLLQGVGRVPGVEAAWPVYVDLRADLESCEAKELNDATDPA